MSEEPPEIRITITPRAQAALDELQALISARYPEATFDVQKGRKSAGISLEATVEVEDTDEVLDVFMDRLVDFQIEGIPVSVRVSQPRERVWAQFRVLLEELWLSRQNFALLPDRIVQDPAIMGGRPVVKETLVQVETVLAHLARDADVDELLSHYPELTTDDVKACLAFARTLAARATRREEVAAPVRG